MDTIFALASAQGKAGVAVIRISGPDAFVVGAKICNSLPAGGKGLRNLKTQAGELLDQALVLTFSNPGSFTGEDVVELQTHGSVAVISALMAELETYSELRVAEPGEFTRRALENGQLDLTQVEALADLIESETEAQRKQAQAVLAGGLSTLAEEWRSKLIRAASLIEVTIDFADEEVPVDVTPEVITLLASVHEGLEKEVAGVQIAERIRDGFEVAIIGAPNVGKSTLLNALAGREAAITSEFAGTTRDVIEVRMDLAGLPVTLLDTAGLRETDDHVEGIGIQRARQRAEAADMRVFIAGSDDDLVVEKRDGDIRFSPKADINPDAKDAISGKTGQGVEQLVQHVSSVLVEKSSHAGLASRQRHRLSLQAALQSLHSAQDVVQRGPEFYDIAAEDMRSAIRHLEMLVGRIGVENLLDEIFSSFCLGK